MHALYHEGASGDAPVRAELCSALRWARALCRTLRARRDAKEARAVLLACKDWAECARRLLTLLNLHTRPRHLRALALGKSVLVLLAKGHVALKRE